jgi:hypothetical protein
MAEELNLDVSPNGDQGTPPPKSGDPAGKGKDKDDVAALRAENETLRKTNQQLSDSERFWADKASKAGRGADDEDGDLEDVDDPAPKGGKKKAAADDADEDLEDPAKFVDALSTQGPRAIAKWLKKNGYVTGAEAEVLATKTAKQAVTAARQAMTHDAELVGDYPDLKDEKSELFKETSAIFSGMVKKDPSLKKSTVALMMAAEQAKLKLQIKGGGSRERDEGGDEGDRELERQRRIRSQNGDRGRRGDSFEDDDDDSMGPQAKEVLAAFGRFGVDEAAYKSERKKLKAGGR